MIPTGACTRGFKKELNGIDTHPLNKVFDGSVAAAQTPDVVKSHDAVFHAQKQVSFINRFSETKYQSHYSIIDLHGLYCVVVGGGGLLQD